MQPYKNFLFLCAALLGFATPCLAVAAGDGAKIVAEVCSRCHTASTRPLDKMHLTREQWNEAIERMMGYGAEVPNGKIPELLDYLVRAHGPAGAATDGANK